MIKWIAALLGFFYYRFPGAVIGFFLGSIIESLSKNSSIKYYSSSSIKPEEFELNLLALSAILIKADGKVEESELAYVRNFFLSQYGKDKTNYIFRKFNSEIKKEVQDTFSITSFFKTCARYETRLQILHFLFGIANSDGNVSNLELLKIEQISISLGINLLDMESIKAMFIEDTDSAYKILEIKTNASESEIKQAYRKMAKKYHPDKIQSSDPAMIKGSEEKFREVKKAYETLISKKDNFELD